MCLFRTKTVKYCQQKIVYCIVLGFSRGVYTLRPQKTSHEASEMLGVVQFHSLPQEEEETHSTSPPQERTTGTHVQSIEIDGRLRSNTVFPNELRMLR